MAIGANKTAKTRGSESQEMYLETILVLEGKKYNVHAVDIAAKLGFSKPTVSEYLKRLKNEALVEVDTDNHVHLTREGRDIAENIYERHNVLTAVFTMMGVSPDIAAEDACRVEHYISEETFQCIKRYFKENAPDTAKV